MKKNFLLALSFVVSSALAAQTASSTAANAKPIRLICTTPLSTQPLVMVDGYETDMQSLVLNPDRIERIDILKDKIASSKYGDKAKDGVILITTKPGTEFYTITDFVNAEKNINISVKQIELNGKLLPHMQKLLIDKKAFPSTLISSDIKMDEKSCEITSNDRLVITTKDSGNKQ